jgi:hypothetical protein
MGLYTQRIEISIIFLPSFLRTHIKYRAGSPGDQLSMPQVGRVRGVGGPHDQVNKDNLRAPHGGVSETEQE